MATTTALPPVVVVVVVVVALSAELTRSSVSVDLSVLVARLGP